MSGVLLRGRGLQHRPRGRAKREEGRVESAFLRWRAVGWSGCLPGMLTQQLLGLINFAGIPLVASHQAAL